MFTEDFRPSVRVIAVAQNAGPETIISSLRWGFPRGTSTPHIAHTRSVEVISVLRSASSWSVTPGEYIWLMEYSSWLKASLRSALHSASCRYARHSQRRHD